ETGVTTSIFPSDEVTAEFLRAQRRPDHWKPVEADPDADYAEKMEIDLSSVIPMTARPHSPGNVVPVSEVEGLPVDQVAIGSCTNSSLRDLIIVGKLLKDKKVDQDTSLIIAPGSRQVFEMIAEEGILADMISAGARVMESTCGFCIGAGQAPGTEAVSVRTSNRNFEGRSGTASAGIYLTSPETAALCALNGKFVDPGKMPEEDFPRFKTPETFRVDDSMIIPPPEDPSGIEVLRGPNIGDPPSNEPLSDPVSGEVAIKVGDKITTDHIMPAGSRLKYRSNVRKYSEFVFEGVDPGFSVAAADIRDRGEAVFIVAGESYGQGSSREHAALCPMYLGVKAVIAKSFERIHAANLVNFGILPLFFIDPGDYEQVDKGDSLEIGGLRKKLDKDEDICMIKTADSVEIPLGYVLSGRQKEILIAGGLLNYTRSGR
ncbi:MAG: aconitate hydratase, partial [Candidatus Omnitrophica bacterium]|nr:aconitate hydratase [Candidatus Omnitrophota bacterium]